MDLTTQLKCKAINNMRRLAMEEKLTATKLMVRLEDVAYNVKHTMLVQSTIARL